MADLRGKKRGGKKRALDRRAMLEHEEATSRDPSHAIACRVAFAG
jgi:hypothetical protein